MPSPPGTPFDFNVEARLETIMHRIHEAKREGACDRTWEILQSQ